MFCMRSVILFLIISSLNFQIYSQVQNDLLIVNHDENNKLLELSLYSGSGNLINTFNLPEINILFSTSGDFDGDSMEEVLFISSSNQSYEITVYKYENSTWQIVLNTNFEDLNVNLKRISKICSGDINGDGIDDLILLHENLNMESIFNKILILKSDGENFYYHSDFEAPDYSISDINSADYNGSGKDEITLLSENVLFKKDRILIYSIENNLQNLIVNKIFQQDDFLAISSGDYNGSGLFQLSLLSRNYGSGNSLVNLEMSSDDNLSLSQRISINEELVSFMVSCDFNSDFLTDVLLICVASDSIIKAKLYISTEVNLVEDIEFILGKKQLLYAAGINVRTKFPHTYVSAQDIESIKLKGNQRGASNYIYHHFVQASNNFNFGNVSEIFKLVTDIKEFNDGSRSAFGSHLKKIGLGYQLRPDQTVDLELAIDALIKIAEFSQVQLSYIKFNPSKFTLSTGILTSQILYDAMLLFDLAMAYDLLFDKLTPKQRMILRTKLFIPLVDWQHRYCSGRGNHQDWHNLIIGEVGFLINWNRYIAMSLKGTDISNHQKGFYQLPKGYWQGLAEQLSNPINNESVIPPDLGYWLNSDQLDYGAYFSDYTDDEGSIFYTHFSLVAMVRLAKIAQNNNYHVNFFEYPDNQRVIDRISTNLASLVYPSLIDYPDINNEILDESPVQTFEILESVLYADPPRASPYTKLLKLFRGSYNGTIVDIDEDVYFYKGYGIEDYSFYENSFLFPKGGWGLIRSQHSLNDPNKLYLLFDFGPYGSNNHGHADRLNLILYSNRNGEILKDKAKIKNTSSGYWGYSSHVQAGWVESSLSHNTILINGQRQADPDYQVFKPLVQDNIYGLNSSDEHLFANRVSEIIDYSINNDNFQYICAKVPFSSAYGPNYEVERVISLVGNNFVVDEINIERKNKAPLHFIDVIYNGPTARLETIPSSEIEIDLSENQINYSYKYLYDSFMSENITENFWQADWNNETDTTLRIYGLTMTDSRLISSSTPADLTLDGVEEKIHPDDKHRALIIRTEGFIPGASEFVNILDPNLRLKKVEYDSEREIIEILDIDGELFKYKIRYGLKNRIHGSPEELNNYELYQNYPNPFNNSTTIRYNLLYSSNVTIKIYNWLGELVMEIPQGWRTPGQYELALDMKNFASGIYLYYLNAENFRQAKKMMMIK